MPDVLEELRTLMGPELLQHEKRNRIYLFGRYLKYPLSLSDLLSSMRLRDIVAAGASAVAGKLRGAAPGPRVDSYEEYIVSRFGRHLYRLVFEPLAEKVWGDPSTLSADIARTRLSSTSLLDVVARVLKLKPETSLTSATRFYYPKAGFGRIPNRMAEELTRHGGIILTSTTPVAVHFDHNTVRGVTVQREDGRLSLPCDLLISTIPFDVLGTLMQRHRPDPELDPLLEAAAQLQYRHLLLVYVVVDDEQLTTDHWIFYPEASWVFGRICEQKQLSRAMIPPHKTVICCDVADAEDGDRWRLTDTQLGQRCIADLRAVGILDDQPIQETFVKRVKRFYPRYDLTYRETLQHLYAGLRRYTNLISTGRIGLYNYNNSDHCVDMAIQIEEGLSAGCSAPEIMERLEQRVRTYRIVD